MQKGTKKVLTLTIVLFSVIALTACDGQGVNMPAKNTAAPNVPITYLGTLHVYNAGEYIDRETLHDFEQEYKIRVEYSEFDSNEDLYDDVVKNPGAYDVLVPSDYTVDRLIKEGRLAKLDKDSIPNIAHIAPEYLNPAYDPDNAYTVPYMVGTLGILYNQRQVTATVDSWSVLLDTRYNGKTLMLDSQRDAIGLALKMLGFSMNSNDAAELAQAKDKLKQARSIAYAFTESEEIRDRIVAGESVLGVVYSGDGKMAVDRNPDLAYVIPSEGSNKWVDGFVIMKDTPHMEAALKFINFMCRPSIAVRNMSAIGYTSPVQGAWSEFGGNKIMFPTQEELDRCEAFLYDAQAAVNYYMLWMEVRR